MQITKKFNLFAGGVPVVVEAEQEGNARYMVRMAIPGRMARIRIGYLTGCKKTWVAEFFGKKPASMQATSAKSACQRMVHWASEQPTVAPFLVA